MQAENLAKQPLSLLGIPLPLLAQIVARALRILQAKCHRDAEKIFKERWQLKYLIGNAIEAKLLSEEVGLPIVPQGLHGAT
jgi:hypothetical protein